VRARPFQAENLRIPLTISIGVAQGREAATIEELFAMADRRVYLAKAMGRDRVVDRRSARPAGADEATRTEERGRSRSPSEEPPLVAAGVSRPG
jgi:c-di-AMP phosphodiesterase-like protein